MNSSELLNICLEDRTNSLDKITTGWIKRNGIDLLIKYDIALVNSIGKTNLKSIDYLFIDEIKNNNMNNNLQMTYSTFSSKNEKVKKITFYKKTNNNEVKMGIVFPLTQLIRVNLRCIPFILASFLTRDQLKGILRILVDHYLQCADRLLENVKECYIMTDHHFYSSIIAIRHPEKTSVIQHGLCMDERFYYPIRAGRFLAWGVHSKEIQKNDEKVVISGTYKFKEIQRREIPSKISSILFCIGSLDNEKVSKKIDIAIEVAERIGAKIAIKCHPGSLFDENYWKERFNNRVDRIYKEELIQDIPFDIAITENSTIIMDLVVMNRAFILFDDINGYFEQYKSVIPYVENKEELYALLSAFNSDQYEGINQRIIEDELNKGICNIYDIRKVN